jgi:hypothetical protein
MPAIALQKNVMSYVWDLLHASPPPQPQGIEGRKVTEAEKKALRQWNDRTEVHLTANEETDDYSYLSVPPKHVFYVKTRYRYAGRMKPRPFPLDE